MREARETHLFTGHGALCDAPDVSRWSLVESRTTCPACLELLEERRRQDAGRAARGVVLLGRIRAAE